MEQDLKHLLFLLKAASSLNLFNNNGVLFKVAVNDYRFYKAKFQSKHGKQANIVEDGLEAQIYWKFVKTPYDGKSKLGFKTKTVEHHYNNSWSFKNT